MITDATGCPLAPGDRIGTVTAGRWGAVLTGEVVRLGAVMVTARVLTAVWSGQPESRYAHLPQPGTEIRLNAWRLFRLEPVRGVEQRGFEPQELRIETYQPGNHVRILHLPTGHEVSVMDARTQVEGKAEAIRLLRDLVDRDGERK